jgi:hypothetical protein
MEQDSLWWKMRNAFQIGRANQHQMHSTLMEDRAVYWKDTNTVVDIHYFYSMNLQFIACS